MSDDLQKLRDAMDAATPAPDTTRRQENIARARENFDRHQETAAVLRPTSERGFAARLVQGVGQMMTTFSTKGALVATTAVATIAMVWIAADPSRFTAGPGPSIVMTDEAAELKDAKAPPRDEGAIVGRSRAPAPEERLTLQSAPPPEAAIALNDAGESTAVVSGDVGTLTMGESDGFIAREALPASPDHLVRPEADTEAYSNEDENTLKITSEDPVSTFSIDVDTASYAVVRSSLNMGQLPPREAVRVEELVNYFPYDYAAPSGAHPFAPNVEVFDTPWNADTQLVRIGIQGEVPAQEDRPPLNLVFLIDTSGSMQDANKLPLLKQSFRLMLPQLRPEDRVAIVTYAGSAGRVLDPTPASDRDTILAALERLDAGGSTAGQQGLQQAYATAEEMHRDGDVNRVILATDGDFNVGLSDPEGLKTFIADRKESGTYLSVLGFGRGNLDDATMQALAQNGNGTAAYIDTLSEARKVLVDQLTGALFPIADDVKIQVEWNPAAVAEYRLIGYETRALARQDFNNDAVDAGEIGAGVQVTALYEIAGPGSRQTDALRYQPESDAFAGDAAELGYLKLRYKAPGASTSTLIEQPILPGGREPGTDARFAAAIAGFGQLLRGSKYVNDWSFEDAAALASDAIGDDPFGYRREAVSLMRLASALSR